ncbi:septum site-determining protein Ssd [Nocardioides sp.]|uniref:septum site-determining protein Ssd n=1 Tax=Nocardioides sp. TaxID=35761 RepID=UPI003529B9F1
MSTPLLVTADELLLEELLRLAAAAGVTPEVAADAGVALRAWTTAPLVLVGLDAAVPLLRLAPPRRPDVHLVVAAPPPDDVFRTAVRLGAQDVVELPRSDGWLVEAFADLVDPSAVRGLTVGVVGGCGGAGASVFATALAQVAARRGPTLLIDADPQGAGLDRMLGLEDVDGLRWEGLEQTTGRLGARSLREAVPAAGSLGVLTFGPGRPASLPAFVAREALAAARRGHETVLLDLPRCRDPLTEELASRCDRVVLVSTATVPAAASTARVAARLPTGVRTLVVRGRGIAGRDLARATGVRDVVAMPDQRGLDEAIDVGLGPVRGRRSALAKAAEQVLSQGVGRAAA